MRLNGISRIQAFITQEHTLCLHGLSRDKGQVRHRWVAALKGFDSTVRAHGFECAFHARGPFLTCSSAHGASAVEVCPLASLKPQLDWHRACKHITLFISTPAADDPLNLNLIITFTEEVPLMSSHLRDCAL